MGCVGYNEIESILHGICHSRTDMNSAGSIRSRHFVVQWLERGKNQEEYEGTHLDDIIATETIGWLLGKNRHRGASFYEKEILPSCHAFFPYYIVKFRMHIFRHG